MICARSIPEEALFKALFILFICLVANQADLPLILMAKMVALRALIGLAAMGALVQLGMGANLAVGGTNGWDISSDLKTWASSQTFTTDDSLKFTYSSIHSVLEVTKADYDACDASNPIKSYSDGSTVIQLSSHGKRYFICGTPGHCSGGMKLEINTVAAATATPPASPATPPPAPATPPPAKNPPPPPKSFPPKSPAHAPSPHPMSHHAHSPSAAPSEAPMSSHESQSLAPSVSPSTEPTSDSTGPTQQHSGAPACGLKATIAAGLGIGVLMLLAL